MKKLAAFLLAALLLTALAIPAFAASSFQLVNPILSAQNAPARIGTVGQLPTPDPLISVVQNTLYRKYQVENKTVGEGTTLTAGYAATGDTVFVSTAPAAGSTLAVICVLDAQGNELPLSLTGRKGVYSFVMPAAKATVITNYAPLTEVILGKSGLSLYADGFELTQIGAHEEADEDYLVGYYLNEATNMDFDVYVWDKEEGVTLVDAVLEENGTYVLTNLGGYDMAYYTSVDEFDGEAYNTVTYIIDAGDQFAEIVFFLDVEGARAIADTMIASLTDADETNDALLELGETGVAVVLPEGFAFTVEGAHENEDEDYMIAYYLNEATNMDFDVYEWEKEEGVTLVDAVLEENETYTLTTIGGYDVAYYTAVDEFDGVAYPTITYIIDAGELFEEVVFYLDADGALAVAQEIMATLK